MIHTLRHCTFEEDRNKTKLNELRGQELDGIPCGSLKHVFEPTPGLKVGTIVSTQEYEKQQQRRGGGEASIYSDPLRA